MTVGVKVVYSAYARKDLLRLERSLVRRTALKIRNNSEQNDPLARAKELTGSLTGLYRYRVGDYRIIFDV